MSLLTAFLVTSASIGITDLWYYYIGVAIPVGVIGHVATVAIGTYVLSRLRI